MVAEAPSRFITLDPGMQASGYAVWNETLLVDVGLLRVPSKVKTLHGRLRSQHAQLEEILVQHSFHPEKNPVVCERMKHYPRTRRKPGQKKAAYIDPDDLISLSLLGGHLATYWVYPSDWKGGVPREVEQDHSRRALDVRERDIVEDVMPNSLRKEAWSAVGIGLSILGRAHLRCGWSFVHG